MAEGTEAEEKTKEEARTEKKDNLFKKLLDLPLAVKVGIVAAIGVGGYLWYQYSQASGAGAANAATGSYVPAGTSQPYAAETAGTGDYYPPVNMGQSTPSTAAQLNTQSGTSGTGLLGAGTQVYQQSGKVYAIQNGGSPTLVSSVLPTGSKVFGGAQNRYWYELPGSNSQYLLTSGTGAPVTSGIGITKNQSSYWSV